MEPGPSLELLESVHHFPCRYMFKAIGKVENGFAARVVAAVREELAVSTDPPFRLRHTSGGKHVSVTLEPTVQTAQQVLDVYNRIQQTSGLLLLF